MPDSEIPVGTLFIDSNVLHKPKWMIDQVVSVGIRTLSLHRGFDGFVTASDIRDGDFSLVLGTKKPDPFLIAFIGLPSQTRSPIVQVMYLKE